MGDRENFKQKKIREVDKYLVKWKKFMVEHDIWEKEEDLENTKELVDKFEKRISVKVGRQEGVEERWKVKLNPKVKKFRRSKLLGKYIVKLLFEWNDKKFENKYLKKLEKSWQRQKKP